jgi:ketosteroid isomerase-like protein
LHGPARIVLAVSLGLACAANAISAETPEQALTRIELAAEEATVHKDRAVLESTFADDFLGYGCSSDKKASKKDIIDSTMSPDYALLDYHYSPYTVHVYGGTATVQGTVVETSKYKGAVNRNNMSWLDVFVLRDGRWQWVANECAIVPPTHGASAAAAKSLLDTDKGLAAKSHEVGFVAAYSTAVAPDARKFDEGAQPVFGRAAILKLMATYPRDDSFDWVPREAVVADSGELGFTWGQWTATNHDAQGKPTVGTGIYVDVWRRAADGAWQWIEDTGYAFPKPKPVKVQGATQ